jgi:uncharacterized lipoprotein YajG
MRKIALVFLLVPIFILSACKTTTSSSGSSQATLTPTTGVPTMAPDCQVVTGSIFPGPKDASAATYAPISADDHVIGSENATMTVIEYSDYT